MCKSNDIILFTKNPRPQGSKDGQETQQLYVILRAAMDQSIEYGRWRLWVFLKFLFCAPELLKRMPLQPQYVHAHMSSGLLGTKASFDDMKCFQGYCNTFLCI